MSLHDVLWKVPIFANLEKPDIDRLEASLIEREYSAGQIIFNKGDKGDSLYIVQKGRVKVSIPSPKGEEAVLVTLSAGEMLGELSFIDGKPRSATVQAIEKTKVLCLLREDFLELMRLRFDLVLKVMEVLAQRLRDTDRLLAETHFLSITSRLGQKIKGIGRGFGSKK
jgi:CRP/FNR family cyclic AMP-dependent transcriptional regulator